MAAAVESMHRGWPSVPQSPLCLEDKFEVLKEIGDGSFGSVVLARVRTGGAHLARRGTLVAVKTMKKSFDSFHHCLELREVIFLRTLPNHPHLVPALDIFLDPLSRKLHIAMEYMDGNLYQLMKARDHKPMDGASVKSILFQILAGLEHIHSNDFFHRDIKPENILVSTSAPQDSANSFRRYSALVTPPSTPPIYTIKIADFGLARETHSKLPYTTYVSTRWYRAPEVLLRAGEYSAPVDIWAIGAMAVEIATLKPLFPGGNEVDQVWRVCEIMGSPGGWVNKTGTKVGGGEWKEGTRLAQKLGFAFPKMAPHSMETILQAPQWPTSLSNFVTWCLMWDPKNRPSSSEAMNHEYFIDAFDPLRPKSSASRLMSRKHTDFSNTTKDVAESTSSISSKTSSWFRKSLITRESAPAVPIHVPASQANSPRPTPIRANVTEASLKPRPNASKRATWTNGFPMNGAPMPILPSIKPVSPLSDTVTAQASARHADSKKPKKVGRQLSNASHGNHYADLHRQEAERALNGQSGIASPPSSHKESFFSHLRKRARRLSGRHQTPLSPNSDDAEVGAGCAPWASNRQSMAIDAPTPAASVVSSHPDFAELDKALQGVRYSLDASQALNLSKAAVRGQVSPVLKRHHSTQLVQELTPQDSNSPSASAHAGGPVSSRTRRAAHRQNVPERHYETPDEEDELLDEALVSAQKAARSLDKPLPQSHKTPRRSSRPALRESVTDSALLGPYLTPSPSANGSGVNFGTAAYQTPSKPVDIAKSNVGKEDLAPKWPTPPYEENEWAAAAAASIFAAQAAYQ